MTFENLALERSARTAVLTLNRPPVLNALNNATLDELQRALRALQTDDEVRAVVITGAGTKAFAAGADIKELAALRPFEVAALSRAGQRVFDLIENLGKPVIAAINGFALGGGCELAMACTIRIAADTARLGQPEIDLGLIPGYGGTQRLPRLVGRGVAMDLLLTGRQVDAGEALRIGLVNRVVPADVLMAEALALADALGAKAPLATACVIEAVNRGSGLPLDAALAIEASLFGLTASTDDMREGTAAFLEKRRPQFRGR
jgi:enoyl-CoA hydratase